LSFLVNVGSLSYDRAHAAASHFSCDRWNACRVLNARWNGTLLTKHLGDISKHQIWRVLREHEISLQRRRSWCISTDPAFAQKAADIVALYLQPPENAVVLSVDEKPHIQALERARGWLKLPNGKALTGFNHECKRHGTTTLFAAL
jgi:hypothetical protein